MQTGFGMLESGCVSLKNEVNIMMKNVVDVVLGGITYWAFGYGLSYGDGYSNPFFSTGSWFIDPDHTSPEMGFQSIPEKFLIIVLRKSFIIAL